MMLVPAECVPVALLLGMALGYAIRTEKTRIVYQENRRLRRALRRKPQRVDEGKHFARRSHGPVSPRPTPVVLPPLDQAPFPDPPAPSLRRIANHMRPDGTVSPLTSVAAVWDQWQRDHRTWTVRIPRQVLIWPDEAAA